MEGLEQLNLEEYLAPPMFWRLASSGNHGFHKSEARIR